MLFITVAFFVLRQVFAKLVFLNKIAANEQFEGVINGGAANVEIFFPDVAIQCLGLKMVVPAVNFLQDMEALVGFAKILLLEVSREDVLYLFDLIRSVS